MANAAGLASYDAAALQQAMQKALPGLLIPSMPNKQSMLRRITDSTAQVNLSKLFRRVQHSDQDVKPWNPAQLAPFTNLGASQPPAYPEAANILYTDGSAATGLEGQSIGAGVYCRAPDLQLAVDPCGISAANTITRAELTAMFACLHACMEALSALMQRL